MYQELFTIKDQKAEVFFPPFVCANEQVAQRIFGNAIQDPAHQFGKNPEDYVLFKVGSYDDVDMKIELLDAIRPVVRGDEMSKLIWSEKHKEDEK
jgi:hypothetical protein